MSGETEQNVSGWTTDTILAHLNVLLGERDRRYAEGFAQIAGLINERDDRYQQRFESQESSVTMALTSAKEAVGKAEFATEKRFDAVNEFRAELGDRARDLMPRSESEALMSALGEKLTAVNARLDRIEGAKGGSQQTIGVMIAAAAVALAAVGIIIAIVLH